MRAKSKSVAETVVDVAVRRSVQAVRSVASGGGLSGGGNGMPPRLATQEAQDGDGNYYTVRPMLLDVDPMDDSGYVLS